VSLLDRVRRRFTRPPELVRAVVLASSDPDERLLAWGTLVRGEGWLVATSRGLRRVPADLALPRAGEVGVLPWYEVGTARWTATGDGGGRFEVTPLTEVEPGVQARLPVERHALADAGGLPPVVRRRVDQTVVACPVRRSGSGPSSSTTTPTATIPSRARSPGRSWPRRSRPTSRAEGGSHPRHP
jgi:hypothetical protein